jgi:hypothetical protein
LALSRDRPLTFRTTESKLNLNIESIRSATYTGLDKRRVWVKLWIKICVMRKNSEGWRPLQILRMTPDIDLVLRMSSWLGVSNMIPRLKDTRQNGDHPDRQYQKKCLVSRNRIRKPRWSHSYIAKWKSIWNSCQKERLWIASTT